MSFVLSQYSMEQLARAVASRPAARNTFQGRFAKMTSEQRRKRADKDFAFFDKCYFPDSLYAEGHYPDNLMLKDMDRYVQQPGVHIIFGPRKHGKTVRGKKLLIWLLLSGRVQMTGTYAETLPKASNILRDVGALIGLNDRISCDYNPDFQEMNSDQLAFSVSGIDYLLYCAAFSEGRSVRGYTRMFGRPQFILGDDVETLESSMSGGAVQLRIDKLAESYASMTDDAVFFIMGNDFSTASALHQVGVEQDQGTLAEAWHVHRYKAWTDEGKPLWATRYKVRSEGTLKKRLKPLSESDWQANYQSNPIPPEGIYFTRNDYREFTQIPPDARGVIYCDPNLSKKGKGDSTAIVALLYSATTHLYYMAGSVVRSFRKSEDLLNNVMALKQGLGSRIVAMAFDGNVTQESTWTDMIRSWCRINQMPFPVLEYKRYRVDDIAKNAQIIYEGGSLLFPAGFAKTPDGSRFLAQFFAFAGKKAGRMDDAPDAVICAVEFIHERKIPKGPGTKVMIVRDYYQF